MKKHLSVFMLVVQSTFFKVLGLLAIMAAAEAGLFWLALDRGAVGENFSLELMVERSHILWVFAAVFAVLNALTMSAWSGGNAAYTLTRLSVSPKWVWGWQAVYNTLCNLLLWFVQILTALALCRWYEAAAPSEFVTGQTVFLAFYRSEFLHALLPFDDWSLWLKNGVAVLALGLTTARYPRAKERSAKMAVFMMSIAAVQFVGEINNVVGLLTVIPVAVAAAAYSLYPLFIPEVDYEV